MGLRLNYCAFGLAASLLAACAQAPLIPGPLAFPKASAAPPPQMGETARETRFDRIPGPAVTPANASVRTPSASTPPEGAGNQEANIALNFDQLTLPAFIQLVYGEILKKNVQIDPKIAERKDLVTLRSGGARTAADIERVARQVLQSYGAAVIDVDGLVRVVPDSPNIGYLPEIQRGAALPDAPAALRPQFYLIELASVRQTDVAAWLRTMFQDRLKLVEDPARNAILLGGTPDTLHSAIDAIRVLDQPNLAGRQSLRISPEFWTAEDLSKRLFEMLTAEGYAVQPIGQQMNSGTRFPIILLPVPTVNEIYVFANNSAILDHVQAWAKKVDQPSSHGIGRNFFTYAVQNTDASALAETVSQLIGGKSSGPGAKAASAPALGSNQGTSAGVVTPASVSTPGVVVDRASNTLIFQGNAEDYPQVRALLTSLDRPAKQVLIEVTVAELQLTGNWQLGVEWAFSNNLRNGNTSTGGTVGGTGLGTGGFSYQLLGSANQIRAAFNALASDSRTTILSSPRIMARNGQQASIEVGQQVPIITSQQTSLAAATTTQTGVLQTVEYHDTGVILHVKPVIHSSDEIELEVQQEVSAALSTTTGVSSSPTFGTRKVSTSLTLRNGSTVILGGLISSNANVNDSGVPLLKDIPLLGTLFRSVSNTKDRTEVLVLITPYIINDDFDAQAITNAFRRQLGDWASTPVVAPPEAARPTSSIPPPPPLSLPLPAPTEQTPAAGSSGVTSEAPVAAPSEGAHHP